MRRARRCRPRARAARGRGSLRGATRRAGSAEAIRSPFPGRGRGRASRGARTSRSAPPRGRTRDGSGRSPRVPGHGVDLDRLAGRNRPRQRHPPVVAGQHASPGVPQLHAQAHDAPLRRRPGEPPRVAGVGHPQPQGEARRRCHPRRRREGQLLQASPEPVGSTAVGPTLDDELDVDGGRAALLEPGHLLVDEVEPQDVVPEPLGHADGGLELDGLAGRDVARQRVREVAPLDGMELVVQQVAADADVAARPVEGSEPDRVPGVLDAQGESDRLPSPAGEPKARPRLEAGAQLSRVPAVDSRLPLQESHQVEGPQARLQQVHREDAVVAVHQPQAVLPRERDGRGVGIRLRQDAVEADEARALCRSARSRSFSRTPKWLVSKRECSAWA